MQLIKQYKASAPGSLMLLGEYAVLFGGYSLVCAIDKRMTVILMPREDSIITISSALGHHQTDISSIEIGAPFQFVLATLKKFADQLPSGCDIVIQSEFSDQVGFASSAAVTVALIKAIYEWLGVACAPAFLIRTARKIIREVQGIGSGADVAACVLGGVVAYRAEPFLAEKIAYSYPLRVIYSGSKTKTVDAIAFVNNKFSDQPDELQSILKKINECARMGMIAARSGNHATLGKMMNEQQIQMQALGVSTDIINKIIAELTEYPDILGAKISGSGLGDCVIGLGSDTTSCLFRAPMSSISLSCKIDTRGVYCE